MWNPKRTHVLEPFAGHQIYVLSNSRIECSSFLFLGFPRKMTNPPIRAQAPQQGKEWACQQCPEFGLRLARIDLSWFELGVWFKLCGSLPNADCLKGILLHALVVQPWDSKPAQNPVGAKVPQVPTVCGGPQKAPCQERRVYASLQKC